MGAVLLDEFTISIPRERSFAAVAGLVVGGIASRHDVTIEALDDLQLALDSVLGHVEDGEDSRQISVVLLVDRDMIRASVGPVADGTAAELERSAGAELGLRRLLDATVDSVTLSEREEGSWVELRKGSALSWSDG